MSLRLRVPEASAGERLDRFLASVPEVGSRAEAERLIADGAVLVGARRVAKSHRLAAGEDVDVEPRPTAPVAPPAAAADVRVAYEDEHLFVIDKPAGLVVHPAAGHRAGTLVDLFGDRIAGGEDAARPGIVHRLDRDTSGLLVVARSPEAHRRLQSLVKRRALEREYLALVSGRPRSRAGTIEAPIGRDRSDPTRHSLDTDTPRDAVTHFELVELLPSHALLRVKLETGRTHQIRVHLAHRGNPLVGDPVYLRRTPVSARGLAEPLREALLAFPRQALHAASLGFRHPGTGKMLHFAVPPPPDFAGLIGILDGNTR